jgi:GTP cyclohydrolase III
MVIRGSLKPIPLSQVPTAALETLKALLPGQSVSRTMQTDTPAGPRYMIEVGALVFFVAADGYIRSAGLVDKKALEEVDPTTVEKALNKTPEEREAEAKKALEPYRDRLNFDKMIARL